jgi:hypothetical protein
MANINAHNEVDEYKWTWEYPGENSQLITWVSADLHRIYISPDNELGSEPDWIYISPAKE